MNKTKKDSIMNSIRDWKIIKLGRVCEFKRGFSYTSAQITNKQTGIKFVTINNLEKEGGMKKNGKDIYLQGVKVEPDFLLSNEDILIANTDMSKGFIIGAPILIEKRGTEKIMYSMDLTKLKCDETKVNNRFLFYLLKHEPIRKKMKTFAQGTNVLHLNHTLAQNLLIPLPPLPEQKKIAEILRTVDEAIEKVDEAIERTERLKKGLIQELLTKGIGHREFKDTDIGRMPKEWEVVRLGEIGRVVTGTTPSTKKMDYWIPPEVVWVTPADLSKVMFSVSDSERKVSKKALKECNLNILPEGSVIMSTRAPVGYIALVGTSLVFNQGCKGLILNEQRVRGEFLVYYLRTMVKKLQSLSGGSTFKELSKDSLEKVSLPLPPLHEQKQITEILMTVDNKLELLREKKKTLEQLKKGLMNDLLTGRRRVKVEPPKETLF